jgi:hypothetical protein
MALSYLEWNDILIQHYFNEDMAGKDVVIFSDKEMIDRIGSQHGEDYNDFKNIVMQGPSWARNGGICKKAIDACANWRQRGLKFPPYFNYLVLFVSVATVEGDFDVKAYYPRLRVVLGEEKESGLYNQFDRMVELWDDLERWSTNDMHEALGRFRKCIRGKWIHVGIPLSQVIFSDSERNILSRFFSESGLDPADPPTEDAIIKQLASWGKKALNRRTLKLLDSNDDKLSDLRQALAELVMNDLCDWDGIYTNDERTAIEEVYHSQKRTLVGAHICLDINEFAKTVGSSIRIKANRAFPDDDLVFDFSGKQLSCHGMGAPGWSTKLSIEEAERNKVFDPSILDWSKNNTFSDNEHCWTSRLRGSDVKVFLPGSDQGISAGWVELQRIQPDIKYYICCTNAVSKDIEQWGHVSNKSFRQLQFTGIPQGWTLFVAENIAASCPGIEALTLPRKSMLHIRGGIRKGKTNWYIDIAPPQIIVDKGADGAVVVINGMVAPLVKDQDDQYSLGSNIKLDEPISIELKTADGSITRNKVIYLTSIDAPVTSEKVIIRDKFGRVLREPIDANSKNDKEAIIGISGAIPVGDHWWEGSCEKREVPTYLSHRIIFIGKSVGQIIEWPDEEMPSEWGPVWAIARLSRDSWQAYFCGDTKDAFLSPISKPITSDRRLIKRWRAVFLTMKSQVKKPKFKIYQDLWKQYERCASRV